VAGLILIAVDRLVNTPPVANAQLLLSRYVIGGALAGTLFATTLILAERRRTFAALKTWRFAAWGFVAGAVTSLAFSTWDRVGGAFSPSLTTARWASASLALASFWGVIMAGVAAANFRLAHRAAEVVDEPTVADRAPAT